MNHPKPDLPLRTLSHLLRTLLASPVGIVALQASRFLFTPVEENWVDVTALRLPLPRLHPAFHGYRIVQISDFHIGTWITRAHLAEAVALVNSQEPDLVAITGDFVTYAPERFTADLVDTLGRLAPRDGTVAVLGNHDHWSGPAAVRDVLAEIGALELDNRVFTLQRGAGRLHVAGVDCTMERLDRLDEVLVQIPSDGNAAILLAHEPDFADQAAASGRFDLQVSGHSHGGQIRLPVIGPPFLPRYARKYPSGLYRLGGLTLYTNRGLGTAEFNLRWNCRPEITVFTLETATGEAPAPHLDSF